MSLLSVLWTPTWDEFDLEAEAYLGHPRDIATGYAYARIGWRRRRVFRQEIQHLVAQGKHEPVVYFMRVGKSVKIGTTTNLRKRMLAFYLGPQDVLAVVPGDRHLESAYHWRFRRNRIEGDERAEIFRLDWRLRLFLSRCRIEFGDVVNGYLAATTVLMATMLWLRQVALLAALLTFVCVPSVQFLRLGWNNPTFPPVREALQDVMRKRADSRRTGT